MERIHAGLQEQQRRILNSCFSGRKTAKNNNFILFWKKNSIAEWICAVLDKKLHEGDKKKV